MGEIHLSYVGYFQFENLLKNRVPFLLLNLGTSLDAHHSGDDLLYLKKHEENINIENIESYLSDKKIEKTHPIVIICPDGKLSEEAGNKLEKLGYINTFVLRNGLKGFEQEKEQFNS